MLFRLGHGLETMQWRPEVSEARTGLYGLSLELSFDWLRGVRRRVLSSAVLAVAAWEGRWEGVT